MKPEKMTVGHYLTLKHREMILFNGLQSILMSNHSDLVLPAALELAEIRKEIREIESYVMDNINAAA